MRTIALLITNLLLACLSATAQPWTRIENLPASDFANIEIIDGIIYTGSGQKIYYSANVGETWQQATFTNAAVDVLCFKKFDGRLYVGTSNGIYSTPLNNLGGIWTHQIVNGTITSFAEHEGSLFASTMGIGIGVFKRNTDGTWANFSDGIPNYSGSVNKMLTTPGGLLAFAGANGNFYKYDKITASWIEKFYRTNYQPGFSVDDALLVGNTVYVSRGNQVLRTDDFGDNWMSDKIGLQNGHNRTMAVGEIDLYALTAVFTGDTNLTWLRKRSRNAPSQTDWSVGAETLDFYSYALVHSGDKTFIASNQGVYLNDPSLGTDLPAPYERESVIFPNPSEDGRFYLQSPDAIDELIIYDWNGKRILSQQNLPSDHEFQIPGKGMYLVQTISGKTVKTFKVIARCND